MLQHSLALFVVWAGAPAAPVTGSLPYWLPWETLEDLVLCAVLVRTYESAASGAQQDISQGGSQGICQQLPAVRCAACVCRVGFLETKELHYYKCSMLPIACKYQHEDRVNLR